MKIIRITLLLFFTLSPALSAQVSFLDKPAALKKSKKCLELIYNFSFDEASAIQADLLKSYPENPAPYFMKGLIIYWQNFPLLPDNPASETFIKMMDEAIHKAGAMKEDPIYFTEGTFFDLFGRAFKAMYWADNGKATKLIPDLGSMYSNTIKGFELKEEFVEFYFSCGLYNYYIEAYTEAHPIYKPLVSFMKDGDKQTGLLQLQYAIDNCIYVKAEALLFMSIIQLNYENDLSSASKYAGQLYNTYPHNSYYWGLNIIILMHLGRFNEVIQLLSENAIHDNSFKQLIILLARAYIDEHTSQNTDHALSNYEKGIEIADRFEVFGDLYKAIAYMGLSRLAGRDNNETQEKKFKNLAEKHTNYNYIISGTGNGSE